MNLWRQVDRAFLTRRIERALFYGAFIVAAIAATGQEQVSLYVTGKPLDAMGFLIDLLVVVVFSYYLRVYSGWLPSYLWPAFVVMLPVHRLLEAGAGYWHLTKTILEADTMRSVYVLFALSVIDVLAAFATLGMLVYMLVREAGDRNVSDEELMHRYTRNAMAHFRAKRTRETDSTYELLTLDFWEMERRDPELNNLARALHADDPAVRFIAARQLLGKKDADAIPVLEACAAREDLIGTVARATLENMRNGTVKYWAASAAKRAVTDELRNEA